MKIIDNQDNVELVHLENVCKYLIVGILPLHKLVFLSCHLFKCYIGRVITFFAIFFGFFEKVSSCETTAKHGIRQYFERRTKYKPTAVAAGDYISPDHALPEYFIFWQSKNG